MVLRLVVAEFRSPSIALGPVVTIPLIDANSTLGTVTEYSEETANRAWTVFCEMPLICSFGAFVLLCTWTLLSLLWYHVVLVSVSQTTNERVRDVYRGGSVVNVADQGCCRNWFRFVTRRRPVSRLPDFSEFVDCDRRDNESPWTGENPSAPSSFSDA